MIFLNASTGALIQALMFCGLLLTAPLLAACEPVRSVDWWQTQINQMQPGQIVRWVTGQEAPPEFALREVGRQRDCLLQALGQAGLEGLQQPRSHSHVRGFDSQARIWKRKIRFTGYPFDRISPQARRLCSQFAPAFDPYWRPDNSQHQACWASLSDDQKQREIIQATAPPGLSRHHWGSEYDFLDAAMDPVRWKPAGVYFKAWLWMRRHASEYGFFQPYDRELCYLNVCRIEERWHWSHAPLALALQDWMQAHEALLEKELLELWGDDPAWSWLRNHWRHYAFHETRQMNPEP